VQIPDGFEKIAHHMTINLGKLRDENLLNKKYDLKVVAVSKNDKIIAVKVETKAPSKCKTKHITVAVNRENGGKPVMSNDIFEWEKLKKPFILKGIVKEI